MVDREKHLTVRTSEDEMRMLHELAERDGLSQSDVVRMLIRRAYVDAFGREKPRRQK